MATIAERIAELTTERAAIVVAVSNILLGGQSAGSDGQNVSKANLAELYRRRNEIDKSLQRLNRGGRQIYVDHSNVNSTITEIDAQVTL
jgi:hypothetical protein